MATSSVAAVILRYSLCYSGKRERHTCTICQCSDLLCSIGKLEKLNWVYLLVTIVGGNSSVSLLQRRVRIVYFFRRVTDTDYLSCKARREARVVYIAGQGERGKGKKLGTERGREERREGQRGRKKLERNM